MVSPMLHRRGGVGVASLSGRLYAVGGHNAPPSQSAALRTASVEVYDPVTDSWTEVAPLSSPRDSIAVCALGGQLYAVGGHNGRIYTDRVDVYDPEEDVWSEVSPNLCHLIRLSDSGNSYYEGVVSLFYCASPLITVRYVPILLALKPLRLA
ncbi:unnamed protein product [Protopolystoma xenopodis]|uniref:Uncharacterized protein n=1 Tax=Protopolystoma xenopodis TaxID=117903 RepID=A0A448XF06_9PLAT|nr:unnamed protein product [Protopolystoma xenopodis]